MNLKLLAETDERAMPLTTEMTSTLRVPRVRSSAGLRAT
jgi:hypothetical protein